MGQIVKAIKETFSSTYITFRNEKKKDRIIKIDPFFDKAKDFYNYYYPYYLQNRIDNEIQFEAGFLWNLDFFEMYEIVSEYYCKQNEKQRQLIDRINMSVAKDIRQKQFDLINELDEIAHQLSYGRYLIYLINKRFEIESKIIRNYPFPIPCELLLNLLSPIDSDIHKYCNLVINEIVDITNTTGHELTIEQILNSYMVFDEKIANNYFTNACIAGVLEKQIPMDMYIDKWLRGTNLDFIPNIKVENGIQISKVDTEKIKMNLLSFQFPDRVFKMNHRLKPNSIIDINYFKSSLFTIFEYFDSSFKEEDIDIFYESITKVGIFYFGNHDYVRVQNKINKTFDYKKNRMLFLCTLHLIRDTIDNLFDLFNTLDEYILEEYKLSLATFRKYIYVSNGINSSKKIKEKEINQILTKLFPLEVKVSI